LEQTRIATTVMRIYNYNCL